MMYHDNVKAIIGFYKNICRKIDGTNEKDKISSSISEFFEGVKKIIIAGAPASGKGTQCELIVRKYGVVHISTGDALRAQVAANTPLGVKAKECMDKGALVPDDLIIGIVKARLAEQDCQTKGWLLDGFPRTGVQAEALKAAGITPTHFVLLDVPDSILVERCVGRRSDPETGKIYHLKFNPPPDDPALRARLVHRSDDTAEAMGKRIKMYHANVDAIIGFYEDVCRKFDGTRDKFAIVARLFAYLDGRTSPVAPGPRVIIAGAPASGKGTQCEELVREFGLVHISTGDELREHVRQGSELGRLAQGYMEAGGLVPDEVMVGIVRARLGHQDCAERGWLLDGFPRTAPQAAALRAGGVSAERFVLLDVPDAVLVDRCVGRRSDPATGRIYHLTLNPPPPDVVGRLVQRSDDTAEAMGKRIKMYHANVGSVIAYYSDIGRRVNGLRDRRAVRDEIVAFVRGELPPDMSGAPPRKHLPTAAEAQEYVQRTLQPLVVDGLRALVLAKPEQPLRFLATWLMDNNPNRPAVADVPRVVPPKPKRETQEEKD